MIKCFIIININWLIFCIWLLIEKIYSKIHSIILKWNLRIFPDSSSQKRNELNMDSNSKILFLKKARKQEKFSININKFFFCYSKSMAYGTIKLFQSSTMKVFKFHFNLHSLRSTIVSISFIKRCMIMANLID